MHYNFSSFFDLKNIFLNENLAIEYLIEKNIIFSNWKCSCGYICVPNVQCKKYRCYAKKCRKSISIFKNTFFYKSKLKVNDIMHLAYFWLCESSSLCAEKYFGFSDKTIAYYFKHFRELVSDSLDNQDFKIGGQDIIVQIDESKFGRRKYNRGHRVEGVWIFGGVEMTNERKVFLVNVPDRSEETLLRYIDAHIAPGSIIISDMWRGYLNIESKLLLRHYTVNHSIEFVNSNTGANTNMIEGTWSGVKRKIPVRKRTESAINLHLLEFVWRRKNVNNLWDGFINALNDVEYLN